MAFIEISVSGLKELSAALVKFPVVIPKNLISAGKEALAMVLDTVGIRSYPPETAANRPPIPYYIRGRGTQLKRGNLGNSERYGSQWQEEVEPYEARARNQVSYADAIGGEAGDQAEFASGYGWKKVFSTLKAMKADVIVIYEAWIDKTIKELGL